MEYLVAGFESFRFIITPDEIEKVLDGFHFVVDNAHVPIEYLESPPVEFLSVYREMYRLLSEGYKFVDQRDYRLFPMSGVTTNLAMCKYGLIHEYQGSMYKSPCFDEPCVSIHPFILYLMGSDDKISVSTRVSRLQYPEYVVGIEMSYAKRIQYECGSSYEELRTTHELESYKDYVTLKERIKAITKGLKFEIAGKVVRPSVRISKDALQDAKHFFFFTSHHCVFK